MEPSGAAERPDVSIFVVSYNTRELTRRCLQSLIDSGVRAEHEILLVDNASADGSADMVERRFPVGAAAAQRREPGLRAPPTTWRGATPAASACCC